MRRQYAAAAVAFLLTLTSCSGPPASPLPASTEAPSTASIPVTPRPVDTPVPADTPTRRAPATPSRASTPIPTPDLASFDEKEWSYTSPDGKWMALTKAAFPKVGSAAVSYYTQLKVSQASGDTEWVVVNEWSEWGLGYTVPQPLSWSLDGRYCYYTNRPVPDGCAVFVNGLDLWKVDLSSGSVEQIMPPSGLWLALSPDETMVAYIRYGGRALVIRDLSTGKERETQLDPGKPYQAGAITWSPDGAAILLTLALQPCSGSWADSTSIVHIDAASLEQTTAIREDRRLLTTVEWPTLDRALLKDKEGDYWWMDPVTNEVTKR